jgi:hypothetical protein
MRAWFIAALVVLSVSGCGGGSSDALAPPGNFSIALTGFDVVEVTWTEPSVPVDGYEVESRVNDGAWQRVHDGLIPAGSVGGWIFLDPGVPELVTLGGRVRSARGSSRSEWSPVATLFRGVRPPTVLTSSLTVVEPIGLRVPPVHLEWVSESQVATAFELERAPVDGPGAGLFVPVVGLAATDRAYDDPDVWEGAWDYRVRAGTGTIWSAWTPTRTEAVQIVPPEELVVSLVAGGVHLAWVNRSHQAEQVVQRLEPDGGATTLAILAAGGNQYLDAPSLPWPATRYTVSASIPGVGAVPGPAIGVGSLTLTQPIPLVGSARLAPGAYLMALSDGGLLHAVRWMLTGAIERDTGGGWEQHDLVGAQSYAVPGVLADQAGHPHTVVYRGYPDQAGTALVHEWWDGAAWKEETVTMAPASDARFGLGPGGALHVLGQRREPAGTYTTVHHVVAGGNVTSTDLVATVLPPPPGPDPYYQWGQGTMAVALDGTAWVVLDYAAAPSPDLTYVLFRRTAAGAWSQELVPAVVTMSVATAIAGSAEDVALLYDRFDGTATRPRILQRGAGGWSAEETVAAPFDGMEVHGATLAADGGRLCLLLDRYPDGLWLTSRGPSGWGTVLLGSPPPFTSWLRLTWDGRTTVVAPHGPDIWTQAWVSLYVEPPP